MIGDQVVRFAQWIGILEELAALAVPPRHEDVVICGGLSCDRFANGGIVGD